MLRHPTNLPTALRIPSFGRTIPCACLRLSAQARRRLGARSFWVWHLPERQICRDGVAGSPKFPGNPDAPTPCSSTPVGADMPCHISMAAVAPALSNAKAPTGSARGAQSHGLGAGCLRFARIITDQDARLACGAWLELAAWDCLPTGLLRKVSRMNLSSSPELLGARTVHRSCCQARACNLNAPHDR